MMQPLFILLILASAAHIASSEEAVQGDSGAQRPPNCPGECASHGTCNEELGRCDCPRHRTGPDCSEATPHKVLNKLCPDQLFPDVQECLELELSCHNACNRRGRCISGFCHCDPGYYGQDCSLSLNADGKPQLLAGTGYQTRAKRPWIYVYELPPELSTWANTRRLDRPTHNLFYQRLLSSGARIADGDKADWYFIPVRQRGFRDSTFLPDAIKYIRETWPWWNQTEGRRHFAIHTGDLGARETAAEARELMQNATWLTHWGLHKDHKYSDWDAAHRPGQDVVIPVYVSFGHFKHFGLVNTPLHRSQSNRTQQRDQTFFFSGRICGDRKEPDNSKPWPFNCGDPRGYSGGVRQRIHYLHSNRTGYRVTMHERRYDKQLLGTKFCLAPLGGGHGQRQILVAFMGCIPVTIGDNVYQPFEPELDWRQFGLQPLESEVPQLHEILAAVTDDRLKRMQASLRCAAQHFVYSSITGGFLGESGKYDAFETTLEILRAMVDHPGTPPDKFAEVDADFKRFMNCGAEELWSDPPAEESEQAPALCSHSPFDGHPPSCYKCMLGSSSTHGLPGGAICCKNQRDLSKCPRMWD